MESNQYVTQEQLHQLLDLVEILNNKINVLKVELETLKTNTYPKAIIPEVSVTEFIEKDRRKRRVFGIF